MRVKYLAIIGLVCVAATTSFLIFGQTTRSSDDPCFVIWQHPGYSLDPVYFGPITVVWRDGAILYLGRQPCLVGKVEPKDVDAAIQTIRDAGFHNAAQEWVVHDADYKTIIVRDTASSQRSWHEVILPNFGGDLNTDPEYRSFIRVWLKTRAAIESLAPIEVRPLKKDETFRGYDPKVPEHVLWRRWRP